MKKQSHKSRIAEIRPNKNTLVKNVSLKKIMLDSINGLKNTLLTKKKKPFGGKHRKTKDQKLKDEKKAIIENIENIEQNKESTTEN